MKKNQIVILLFVFLVALLFIVFFSKKSSTHLEGNQNINDENKLKKMFDEIIQKIDEHKDLKKLQFSSNVSVNSNDKETTIKIHPEKTSGNTISKHHEVYGNIHIKKM